MTHPTVVFLDRDGTIIRDVHYIARADDVELLPGAAAAIRQLNDANIPVVVVTNQSGIARGLFTLADYRAVSARLDELLATHHAHIDASYFCPHHPDVGGVCECRKPGAGLFRDAARDLSLDLSAPAFIGDRWRDLAPSRVMGGRGVLLRGIETPPADLADALAEDVPIATSLADAVSLLFNDVPTRRARIAVLASGNGTNLQAVLDHFAALGPGRSGDVVVVASNRAAAHALERARTAGIAAESFNSADTNALLSVLERHRVDIVSLAGYLKLIPAAVVDRYRGRIINVHPGPLPEFGGPGMYGTRVHAAVLAAGASETCVTVHLVDEQYDSGATLATWPVPVQPDDTPHVLAARVLDAEHIIYPRILDALAAAVVSGGTPRTD